MKSIWCHAFTFEGFSSFSSNFWYFAKSLRWRIKAFVDQLEEKKLFTLNLNDLEIFKNSKFKDICRKA